MRSKASSLKYLCYTLDLAHCKALSSLNDWLTEICWPSHIACLINQSCLSIEAPVKKKRTLDKPGALHTYNPNIWETDVDIRES